jgi:hypothetical protein
MHGLPMFVHCCHCTRCQRETGSSFAHHAIIEFSRFSVLQGEPEFVLVPTDSGGKHWVARCPDCRTAMQAWLTLPVDLPLYRASYDAAKTWPAESLERYKAAKAVRATQAKASRATAKAKA